MTFWALSLPESSELPLLALARSLFGFQLNWALLVCRVLSEAHASKMIADVGSLKRIPRIKNATDIWLLKFGGLARCIESNQKNGQLGRTSGPPSSRPKDDWQPQETRVFFRMQAIRKRFLPRKKKGEIPGNLTFTLIAHTFKLRQPPFRLNKGVLKHNIRFH